MRARSLVRSCLRRGVLLAVIWCGRLPGPLSAQFVTPLPKPLPAESSFARSARLLFVEAADSDSTTLHPFALADSALRSAASAHHTAVGLPDSLYVFCRDQLAVSDTTLLDLCHSAYRLKPGEGRATTASAVPRVKRHIFTRPFRYQEDVLPLYDTAGTGGVEVLRRVASSVSDQEMYVTTDVANGLVGGLIFGVSYAAVVSRKDSIASRQDTLSAAERESGFANVVRLINNGGTFTGRLQVPLYSGGGSTMQHSGSIYLQAGALGPLRNTDSLHFSGAVVAEWLVGVAMRNAELTHRDTRAELIIGGRAGFGWSAGAPIVSSGKCAHRKCSTLPFAQLALGLRQSGTLGVSFLFTFVPSAFSDYKPRVGVNLSAIRP